MHRLLVFAATASAAQQRCGCAVIGANASLAANPACPARRGHDALDAGTAELTVAYLYYRDVAYAARHVAAWNAYDDALLAKLLFLIADDGSPSRAAGGHLRAARAARPRRRRPHRRGSGVERRRREEFGVSRRAGAAALAVDSDQKLASSWTGRSPTDRPAARSCAASPASSSRRAASIGACTRASSSSRGGPTGPRAAATRRTWSAIGTDLAHYGRVEKAAGCALEAAASAPPLVYMDEPREKAAFFSRSTRRNRGVLDAKFAGEAPGPRTTCASPGTSYGCRDA
ncbi:hypothetical protein JL721_4493 [Aureococcus anophagefferens]|nr:hypothetical protein JL721_4493 [Aureococcus anophagefferens]